jgi:hypothetical protein
MRKPNPSMLCSRCAQWIPTLDTLRITAEERVAAGSLVTFAFLRTQLELTPPSFGVAKDSPAMQVMHSHDARQVLESAKYRSVCSNPAIASKEIDTQGCVRGRSESVSSSHDGRVTVTSSAATSPRSAVLDMKLAAFDPAKTALSADQQVVGPVVALWFEPGVQWNGSLDVAVPISRSALVGSCLHVLLLYMSVSVFFF